MQLLLCTRCLYTWTHLSTLVWCVHLTENDLRLRNPSSLYLAQCSAPSVYVARRTFAVRMSEWVNGRAAGHRLLSVTPGTQPNSTSDPEFLSSSLHAPQVAELCDHVAMACWLPHAGGAFSVVSVVQRLPHLLPVCSLLVVLFLLYQMTRMASAALPIWEMQVSTQSWVSLEEEPGE